MIHIDNIRKSEKTLKKLYPKAKYVDVTSKARTSLVKLSPFYPHGDIPIPFSEGRTAKCVEGIWQGLKVFEYEDIDERMFDNGTMKNIKRTVRKFGKPKGHRKGIKGTDFLDYIQARIYIFLPSYLWVLENKVTHIIKRLREASKEQDIVLLDYATNCDVLDPRKPLSHAYLVKSYVENNFPIASELEKKIEKIKRTGKNPYEFIPKKSKNNLSEEDEKLIMKIIELIENRPLSSKEIINELNLTIKPRQLTRMLKKSEKIQTLRKKPFVFRKSQAIQLSFTL